MLRVAVLRAVVFVARVGFVARVVFAAARVVFAAVRVVFFATGFAPRVVAVLRVVAVAFGLRPGFDAAVLVLFARVVRVAAPRLVVARIAKARPRVGPPVDSSLIA
jgi:hypothetical protein